MQFFETVMGHKFFEVQVPKLVNSLERIANALDKEPVYAGEVSLKLSQVLCLVPLVQEIVVIEKEGVIFKGYSRAFIEDSDAYRKVQNRIVSKVITHKDEEDILFIYL